MARSFRTLVLAVTLLLGLTMLSPAAAAPAAAQHTWPDWGLLSALTSPDVPAPAPAPTSSATSVAPSAGAAASAEERPARYDVVVERDVPITMRDGRILRADIHRPAIKGTTEVAPGTFPVILVQTPYGKSVGNSGLGAMNPYLIKRGYIGVIVDVAGTGGSEGQSMLFGRSEGLDGAEMVRWSAKLEGSNGKVGLLGGSYLGIDQVFTAAAVGKDSPLKAIFPIATAADPTATSSWPAASST